MGIPKVVHRIWFGPHAFPDEYARYGADWIRLGYQVEHWTETNLPPLVNQQVYDDIAARDINTGGAPQSLGIWTQRADVVSYELVRLFGGIYANCDIEPLRVLDILDDVDAFAGWEAQNDWVCNAIFGTDRPHHPFAEALIEEVPRRFYNLNDFGMMQQQTGPGCITAVCARMPEVTVFDQGVFYPYGFGAMDREHDDHPDAYTAHHWGHTKAAR